MKTETTPSVMRRQSRTTNLVGVARITVRSLQGALPGAPTAGLHRALGWRLLKMEGYILQEQSAYLRELLIANPPLKSVLEIGFNAGHSACTFLSARPDTVVVSFDLGEHGYVRPAADYVARRFPGRHRLILGDSRDTVPAFCAQSGELFDLVFVDGGHSYEVALADLVNCAKVAAPDGLVVMDDLQAWKAWGQGPVRAWRRAQCDGLVEELQVVHDGRPSVQFEERSARATWAVGRYLLSGTSARSPYVLPS